MPSNLLVRKKFNPNIIKVVESNFCNKMFRNFTLIKMSVKINVDDMPQISAMLFDSSKSFT